jgi:hypothetical protein
MGAEMTGVIGVAAVADALLGDGAFYLMCVCV